MLNAATLASPTRIHTAAQRFRRAVAVAMATRILSATGFRVLRIEQDHARPRIFISADPLCATLEGATSHFERSAGAERRYKQINLLECEVRWAEGGAA